MSERIPEAMDMRELGTKLKQARKMHGLTQAEAAQIIDVARTTMTAIEKGERGLKAGELIALARAYGQPVSDFVRPRPIMEPFLVQFRTSYRRTDQDEEQIGEYIEQFEQLCRNYLELETITGSSLTQPYPPEYPLGALHVDQAAEVIAQQERNRLGLGDGPIPILRDVLEQDVGLRIFYVPMKPSNKYSAMYAYDPQLGGCIAVNRLHPEERRRMSLSHDYGHFLANRYNPSVSAQDGYQRRPESEQFADAFAIHFLMPTSGLKRRFNHIRQQQQRFAPADLCTLAHYYGVSAEAMARRLEDLKLLPTGIWDKLRDSESRVQKAQKELGLASIPANDQVLPQRYLYLAIYAYDQGLISEGQLARFLQVNRLEARRMAEVLPRETQHVLENASPDLAQSAIA